MIAGAGTNAKAMKPKREFPQPRPSVAYILGPASGINAPNKHLMEVRPAIAEAANGPETSMKYVWMGTKIPIIPKPNGAKPRMGTIQCTCLSADHPYQKKLMGTKNANIRELARRISGV